MQAWFPVFNSLKIEIGIQTSIIYCTCTLPSNMKLIYTFWIQYRKMLDGHGKNANCRLVRFIRYIIIVCNIVVKNYNSHIYDDFW